jgi:hypothetical protein
MDIGGNKMPNNREEHVGRDDRIENDDWHIGPRDFVGYEGSWADERNYGYYNPPYWRPDQEGPRRMGDWSDYLARRRRWLQSQGQTSNWDNGPFAGRGPKGYQRSDERIREDVNDRLTDHPAIDATEIEVRVTAGEVTLSGTVESRRVKRLAEDIVDSVRGVRDVHNELRVAGVPEPVEQLR